MKGRHHQEKGRGSPRQLGTRAEIQGILRGKWQEHMAAQKAGLQIEGFSEASRNALRDMKSVCQSHVSDDMALSVLSNDHLKLALSCSSHNAVVITFSDGALYCFVIGKGAASFPGPLCTAVEAVGLKGIPLSLLIALR